MSRKFEEVYLVCLLHSEQGGPIKAVLRSIPGNSAVIALCPVCIETGRSIVRKAAKEAGDAIREKLVAFGHAFEGEPAVCSRCTVSLNLLAAGSKTLGRPVACGEAEEQVVEVEDARPIKR